jgi:hypothetical protein
MVKRRRAGQALNLSRPTPNVQAADRTRLGGAGRYRIRMSKNKPQLGARPRIGRPCRHRAAGDRGLRGPRGKGTTLRTCVHTIHAYSTMSNPGWRAIRQGRCLLGYSTPSNDSGLPLWPLTADYHGLPRFAADWCLTVDRGEEEAAMRGLATGLGEISCHEGRITQPEQRGFLTAAGFS